MLFRCASSLSDTGLITVASCTISGRFTAIDLHIRTPRCYLSTHSTLASEPDMRLEFGDLPGHAVFGVS
jgi:hypothetical protein